MTGEMLGQPMLTRRQVAKKLLVSEITIYRWCRDGIFPKPLQIGPRTNVWPAGKIELWLSERNAEAEAG